MCSEAILTISKITNFSEFYANATKSRSEYFLTYMSFHKRSDANKSFKFAIVASKKGVHKRAVKRNRVRRRLKNALNQCLKSFELPSGIDIQLLFMANRNVLEAPWEDLLKAINYALQKSVKKCSFTLEQKV
ncbi:ribonuclease P protein component [Fluviispira multicolorata]|uniref:Ribonuclease P protein component n=1 Tax=Fluviispira multicolorata TaxID=2654512 RepID=A0A833JH69_9BACT|nr:ribonuclease P protein component [Fluviispira multicolorata]KAB8033312.1 ribonuclease P protein component [Fluviispira multicolorata]